MARKPVKKRIVRRTGINTVTGEDYSNFMDATSPPKFNSAMSLCGQAEDAISNLEARLSKIIRRINSIIN